MESKSMDEEPLRFRAEPHGFTIDVSESCMIRTVSLNLEVQGPKRPGQFSALLYVITEGDHIWNTLVVEKTESELIDIALCIDFLRQYADQFAREHRDVIALPTQAKANAFSQKVLRTPVNLRGAPYPVPYPGSQP
jgi:hypothetical protein